MKRTSGGQRWLSFFALVLTLSLTACGQQSPELLASSGPIFGTTYQVKWSPQGVAATKEDIDKGILQILQRIDGLMSTYKQDSELSRFNLSPVREFFSLDPETAEVINLALQISEISGGAFDVTVGDLVRLWGFGPDFKPTQVPSDEQIQAKKSVVGYRNLQFGQNPNSLQKRTDLYVDLSAVAKGHAVDKVADFLLAQGVSSFLVEVGGELRSQGRKPNGEFWRIAVESPLPEARQVHSVISLETMGMATSGDYRNFFEEQGVRYSHTIDPRTGRPIQHKLASVTVLHTKAAIADAWATALMVLGEEEGYQLAVEKKIAAMMIIKAEGQFKELTTPAFSEAVKATEEG